MKIRIHKTLNQLAVIFDQQDMAINNHRCREWIGSIQQDPDYHRALAEEGVEGVSMGNHQNTLVVLLTFTSQDMIKEFLLDRVAYTQDQVGKMYRDLGKDPTPYFQQAFQQQQQQQSFFFHM